MRVSERVEGVVEGQHRSPTHRLSSLVILSTMLLGKGCVRGRSQQYITQNTRTFQQKHYTFLLLSIYFLLSST